MAETKTPYRLAVGLEYDEEGETAPLVSVKGEGERAAEVVRLARRYGVPVVERKELARALNNIPIDGEIPQELFHAVAVVLKGLDQ